MAIIRWNWIPNKGVDCLYFGDPIKKHVKNLGLIPEGSVKFFVGWDRYAFPNENGFIDCKKGKVIMISTHSKLMYKTQNIIGMELSELVSLLNFPTYEIEEAIVHDSGDVQYSIVFEDSGLTINLREDEDIVLSISCLKYEMIYNGSL